MENLCKCICHKKGFNVMHIRACCQYSGLQYINSDGTIDQKVIDDYEKEKTEIRNS